MLPYGEIVVWTCTKKDFGGTTSHDFAPFCKRVERPKMALKKIIMVNNVFENCVIYVIDLI